MSSPIERKLSRWLACCALVVFLSPNIAINAQVLESARERIRSSRTKNARGLNRKLQKRRKNRETRDQPLSADNGHSKRSSFDWFGEFGLTELCWKAAAVGLTSPYWGPTQFVGDDFVSNGYFDSCPGDHGCLGYDRNDRSFWSTSLARLEIDSGTNFDGAALIGGKLLYDTPIRFGIDAETRYRNSTFMPFDGDLWNGDANIVYRFAQSPRVQFRSGVGINWMEDANDFDVGFNFTYGGDIVLSGPWIVTFESDLGRLRNDFLLHGKTTVGRAFQHTEWFIGFDYLRLDGSEDGNIVGGVRFWF